MPGEALSRVQEIACKVLEFAGMELVHLEINRHPGGALVRVYIDKEGGVTIDDCALISRQISAQLDIEDPMEGPYTLEVSSPGLDRPLVTDRDFERFAGRRIRVSTHSPIGGQRNFKGRLIGLQGAEVRLALDKGEVAIPLSQVARARLEIDLEASESQGIRGRHA